MNRETIIQMARDAGVGSGYNASSFVIFKSCNLEEIERFAAAIRAATKEEDAGICDLEASKLGQTKEALVAGICAATIRASK